MNMASFALPQGTGQYIQNFEAYFVVGIQYRFVLKGGNTEMAIFDDDFFLIKLM